jgi:hypothetical protein
MPSIISTDDEATNINCSSSESNGNVDMWVTKQLRSRDVTKHL